MFVSLVNYFRQLIVWLYAENFCRADYSDITSNTDSLRKEVTPKKTVADLARRRVPLSVKGGCQNFPDSQHCKTNDWQIDIAIPKSHGVSLADIRNEESEGSSVTKTLERFGSDITSAPDAGCEYVPVDDEQECSSMVSNFDADNFETKFVTTRDLTEEGGLMKTRGRNQQFAAKRNTSDEQDYLLQNPDRRSLESTVTRNSFQPPHGCCSQIANDMTCIQKQLAEIENKQSNIVELLQVNISGNLKGSHGDSYLIL